MADNSTEELCLVGDSPPAPHRRSTFFEKRASIMPETIESEENGRTSVGQQYIDKMSLYLKELKREEQSWKDELQDKKMLYLEAKQRHQSDHGASSARIDYSLLTPEDINLMKSKPSVSDLAEKVSCFEREVKLTLEMCNIHALQMKRLVDENHSRLDRIQKHILENSGVPTFTANIEDF